MNKNAIIRAIQNNVKDVLHTMEMDSIVTDQDEFTVERVAQKKGFTLVTLREIGPPSRDEETARGTARGKRRPQEHHLKIRITVEYDKSVPIEQDF